MKSLRFDKSFFYKNRYIIGYSLLALVFSFILLFASLNLPGGLTQEEMASVVTSNSLSFSDLSSFAITNLPYHIFQHISLAIFGVSTLSIKLPSLLAALGTVVGLIMLLRIWFKPSLSILATTIIITTGQFLMIAQAGTPDIMYLFWSVWTLVLSIKLIQSKNINNRLIYKILLAAVIALSLYAPLSIYILIALALAVSTHPHLRHLIKKMNRRNVAISLSVGGVLLLPLLISVIYKPSLTLSLLGAPAGWPNIPENLSFLFHHYFNFINASDISAAYITFNITAIILIIIGIVQLIKTRETARSYVIATWGLLLIIPTIIHPLNTNVLFIPLALLLTMGLSSVLTYWYRLFPLNPYARVVGLIPIIILISSVVLVGLENYIYGYSYNPAITSYFSQDISLLPKDSKTILVSKEEQPFYNVLARHNNQLTIVTEIPSDTNFTATRSGRPQTPEGFELSEIITSANYRSADRFYVFTKTDNK